MATFTKRGDLQWRVQIRRRGHPTISKTFEKKSDAEAWAREIEGEMDRGVFISRKEAEATTLNECLERFIEEYIPRLKRPENEIRKIRKLQQHPIVQRIMATIRSKDIADFRKDREKEGVKPNTIRLDFALLSRLFNYARSDWGMESLSNPVELTTKPKVGKGRERRLEEGEEERLLKAAAPNLKPIILFALATAMRREEIASLEWKRVNLKERYLILTDTKNSETRIVPLSEDALHILKSLSRKIHTDQVFSMSASAITQAMEKTRNDAKIEDLKFHDLRHEAISRLFENTDLDVMEIKAISGHKTLQMLARYTHLRTARLADRLAGAKRGASKD
ncbi:site-specific integrase [Desulfovibrio sp. OttesenSCG-928-G11]|nr:site-specific integrase [Desulfovibrio sp. OttesenSCG-928-G11]